jgi:hypothetical protein
MYGASKVMTENLTLGQPYSEIKKIISINIVYFDLGQGKDYVYKGTTNFHGLHENDVLQLSYKQKETFLKQNVSDIFPEYYIIKVNQFNDVAKDTLDEWIYFLKNSEVKDDFKAKGLSEAKEILDIMRLGEEQRYSYNRYMDYLHYKASEALTLKIETEQKIKEAVKKATKEIEEKVRKETEERAINAIKKGLDNQIIAELTGLSVEQIEKLRKERE